MVELGVAGVAPLPLRLGRPLPEGALALGGGLTPGAFSPPPGPLGFSASPIATTRSFTSLSRASLSGSPASCSRATRIWSFVIRLPSSGIRGIRSLTRSARTGIGASSGKAWAKRQQSQGLGTGAEPGWPHDALAGLKKVSRRAKDHDWACWCPSPGVTLPQSASFYSGTAANALRSPPR